MSPSKQYVVCKLRKSDSTYFVRDRQTNAVVSPFFDNKQDAKDHRRIFVLMDRLQQAGCVDVRPARRSVKVTICFAKHTAPQKPVHVRAFAKTTAPQKLTPGKPVFHSKG